MRSLADTIARLAVLRGQQGTVNHSPGPSSLQALDNFGSNPGALKAWTFVPDRLPENAPLVVILHGCLQTAAEYDHGSGWSALAGQGGFALLYPEQQRPNNPNGCFNWFNPEDTRRGRGEAASIY
jgi:poly(3-hydroxybutyrate) depolymerase